MTPPQRLDDEKTALYPYFFSAQSQKVGGAVMPAPYRACALNNNLHFMSLRWGGMEVQVWSKQEGAVGFGLPW